MTWRNPALCCWITLNTIPSHEDILVDLLDLQVHPVLAAPKPKEPPPKPVEETVDMETDEGGDMEMEEEDTPAEPPPPVLFFFFVLLLTLLTSRKIVKSLFA